MPLQFVRENVLKPSRGLLLVKPVEAGALERVFLHFEDPGRSPGLVLVTVRDDDAVLGFLEEERERVEQARRAHPREFVRTIVDLGSEMRAVRLADAAVRAVAREDQIGICERG